MLTGTTELALRALIHLGLAASTEPIPPRRLAGSLRCSPTYLGKTLGLLVKADVLRSVRGARGGVLLARDPRTITLLEVVEACQGTLVGDYCRSSAAGDLLAHCRFHEVMLRIHGQVVRALTECTLAELLECPLPRLRRKSSSSACRMAANTGGGAPAADGTRTRRRS